MRFYISTPIYYVNAVPHLGTFYSTVVADALARYHRARGHETYFLTGTDEHGQKIEQMARAAGKDPKAYCDDIVARFKTTWKRAEIEYDRFIRTTDEDHEASVQEMWRRIAQGGYLRPGEYDGLYCTGCEDWKTDDELVPGEGGVKLCPIHQKPVDRVKEPNFFFRLSAFKERLLRFYDERRDFIQPDSRRNEVIEFVRGDLRDISVSRTSVKWGIPVPGTPDHTIYVWIDALTNYISALGGPAKVQEGGDKEALWTAGYHLIAKDILRFHAVYWPAMLMAAGLPLPRGIFCHGYITVKGQKISKSIPATRVDPNAIADELGIDPLRYFVLREYTLGNDGDFTYESLFGRYEADLGNDLGNLLNRTIAMAHKYVGGHLPPLQYTADVSGAVSTMPALAAQLRARTEGHWEEFAPSRALEATWELVRAANTYVDRSAPWALAKVGDRDQLVIVLANCCEALRWAALMVAPVMPRQAREILRQLGRESDLGGWPAEWHWPGGQLAPASVLFPRIEPERQAALIARWMPPDASGGPPAAAAAPRELTREDFDRLDLRAARVLACKRIPKTEKLLELTLDIGTEQRTVVSGIAGAYRPETLVGRTVIYVANLKPAKIRGVLSQGMILAAGEADVLALGALDRDVPPGTRVR